LNQPKIIKH